LLFWALALYFGLRFYTMGSGFFGPWSLFSKVGLWLWLTHSK
jgi:hypothetical protein